jgi:hypothetical protein
MIHKEDSTYGNNHLHSLAAGHLVSVFVSDIFAGRKKAGVLQGVYLGVFILGTSGLNSGHNFPPAHAIDLSMRSVRNSCPFQYFGFDKAFLWYERNLLRHVQFQAYFLK